jgi:LPXTG-motif cell wall-anchored protein
MECWLALLGDTVPPDARQRYERHLESCPACQRRLDQAVGDADGLLPLVRAFATATAVAADPALAEVLGRLHDARAAARAAPADLYFLRPPDRPGILGTLGAYEVREVVGQGGMGVVLKAFDPALERLVAIKVMAATVAGSPTARRRFIREARAAAAVCHEHVVTVHGVHEDDGLPYLVMQYVAGESLQDRLERGPLEPEEVVRIGLQTAWGLAAAHAQGLIHRDIKPANLLLENGLAKVKITDFGLARAVDDVGLTTNGAVAGTPEYMAPEQARGEPVDHRADLFSLGAVLYACCTGVAPFRGSTAVAVLRRVCDEAPPAVRALNPGVPAWLAALVGRLMARDPARRFQSAAEVAALLEGYLAHLRQPAAVPDPQLSGVPAADGPGRSWRARLAPGGRLLLGLAALAFLTSGGLVVSDLAGTGAPPRAPAAGGRPVRARPPDGAARLWDVVGSRDVATLSAVGAEPSPDGPEGAAPRAGSKGWLAAVLLGLLFLLALAGWFAVRRRRAGTGSAPGQKKPTTAAPLLPVSCPGCGEHLNARAELAGKRVQCPQCRQSVLVPHPEASETGPAVD